jgi:hypothetical protein
LRPLRSVFVPYCTGDLHAGNNVASYTGSSGPAQAYDHLGHANVLAFLPRITATWPAPRKLTIAGSDAGGYGALFNYATIRAGFHAGETYLIDDSGPPLPNGVIPSGQLALMFTNWNLGALLDPQCSCPRRARKVYHSWAVENVPGVGGHLKVYHRR